MGYYMEQIGQDFTILAENKVKAFEALKQWEQEKISSYSYPLNILPLGDASTLEEAMDPQNAQENLRATAEQVFRLLALS